MGCQTTATWCMVMLCLLSAAAPTTAAAATVTAPADERDASYCYMEDPDPYNKLATKTAYTLARGQDFTHRNLVPEGCEARQAWHLVRHGTRYPEKDEIEELVQVLPLLQADVLLAHEEGRGELCKSDVVLLANWSTGGLNTSWHMILTPQGHHDLQHLSTRYQEAVPNLLRQPFSNDSFKFRHTASQRTEASAKSYARGLFGHEVYMPAPLDPDPLLRYYLVCDKYLKTVRHNPEANMEQTLFADGPEMGSVVARVSRRLGVDVDFSEIEMMYHGCRYYKAWNPSAPSPWCVAFTPEDLKVLEYWQDLHYYYIVGYGHNINYEMACPLVQDVLQYFSAVVEGNGGPKGVFYFSHTTILQSVMARLGLFQDAAPFTHDHIQPDRQYRTSLHGSFATNLAFTLSSCDQDTRWWVSAAVSEEVVPLEGCASTLGCTWEEFVASYGRFIDCDFDAICSNTSGTSAAPKADWTTWDYWASGEFLNTIGAWFKSLFS